MNHFRQILLIGVVVVGCVSAGAMVKRPAYARAEQRQGEDLTGFVARLTQSLARAAEVEVLEGLPHPVWEKDVFAAEKAAVRNIVLHDALFYAEAHQFSKEHREVFAKIWPAMVSPFRGEKLCGGFHADYALRWKEGGLTCSVLICFGCHEVAAFLPKGNLRADLKGEGVLELRELLRAYAKQRPAAAAGTAR